MPWCPAAVRPASKLGVDLGANVDPHVDLGVNLGVGEMGPNNTNERGAGVLKAEVPRGGLIGGSVATTSARAIATKQPKETAARPATRPAAARAAA